jgi:hypothetical protein
MPTFPNAELLKKVLPQSAANAPRMVNFTGVPEGMGGNEYYGLGLGGIDDMRQKLAQTASSSDGLAQVHEPLGVAGYGLGKLGDVLRERQAVSAERATRDTLAGIIGGIDPAKGPTMEQVQSAFEADPGYGQKLYEQLIASQNRERWEPVPGQPGIQRNTVTGETKSTGDASGAKLSDIASIRQDYISDPSYKNWAQASPIWSSVTDAATRDTPQSDLNIIIGMAKLFDPGSVVRSQEGEQVQQTAGLPTEIFSAWKYLSGQPGSRLDAYQPGMRKALLDEGYSRMQGYHAALKAHNDWISSIATRHGVDPRDVVETMPVLPAYGGPAQPDPNKPPTTPPDPLVTPPQPDDTTPPKPPQPEADLPDAPPPRPAWASANDPWPTDGQWAKLSPENKKAFVDWSKATKRPGDF